MLRLPLLIACCFCYQGALAHVVLQQSRASSSPALRASVHTEAPKNAALQQLAIDEGEEKVQQVFPTHLKKSCNYMLFILVFICCGGGLLKEVFGDQGASAISLVLSMLMLFYLFESGIISAWWGGAEVGQVCRIMCWWLIFQVVITSLACCCVCVFVGAVMTIKNEMIKKMKQQYEEKVKELSGPRQEYYNSDLFKEQCHDLFDKYDSDGSGSLDMQELRIVVIDKLGEQNVQNTPLLLECFDESHSSQVERDEFVEMMKFVSVMHLQDGKFTEEQAFEVLLLPDTATMEEVSKAHRRLAMRYHPDKRPNDPKDIVDKDMSEVNLAYDKLKDHFKALKEAQGQGSK
jgi:hypothetical protein